MQFDIVELPIDFDTVRNHPIPVGRWSTASVQVIPLSPPPSTGVVEIMHSLTGSTSDAVSFSIAVEPVVDGSAVTADVDVGPYAFIHVAVTTAETGKRALVVVYLTDREV
jgi:hypothetical protein